MLNISLWANRWLMGMPQLHADHRFQLFKHWPHHKHPRWPASPTDPGAFWSLCIFQPDGAPRLEAKLNTKRLWDQKINNLHPRPGNSPVFNPIENLCSVLKRWLEKSANWSSGFSDEAGVDPANQKMCGHDRGRLLERCWCSEARTICYKLNRAAADSASSLWLVIKLSPAP